MVTGPAVSCRASPATSGASTDTTSLSSSSASQRCSGVVPPGRAVAVITIDGGARVRQLHARERQLIFQPVFQQGKLRGEDAEVQRQRVGTRYEQHPVPEPQRASFAGPRDGIPAAPTRSATWDTKRPARAPTARGSVADHEVG